MIAPFLVAALIAGQALPVVSSEKSRAGTGATVANYRFGVRSASTSCLGGTAPLFIPFGASVTMTSTLPATICFVQGSSSKNTIVANTAVITTVGLYGDGAGACTKLEPSFGRGEATRRLENWFYPNRQIPGTSAADSTVVQPGRAKGVCATGGVLSGVTTGRPCWVDGECVSPQTCVVSEAARAYQKGAYVCGRAPADASVFLEFEW